MDYKVFGCKTNKYFAEKWLVHPHLQDKTGYFIASCVVTDKAKAKWVKHAKKRLPLLGTGEKLFLSGCGNIRNGVVDPKFFEIYSELKDYQDKIEILPEDPEDIFTPLERGDKGGSLTQEIYGKGLYIPFRKDLSERAQELRKSMTGPEKNIWYNLLMNQKLGGYKFVRQRPILDYIVDFYCHELRLAIEIDGESHEGQKQYDANRTLELGKLGIEVLRFTNTETLKNLDRVRETILGYIHSKTKNSPVLRTSPLQRGVERIRSLAKLRGKEIFTRKYMVIQTGCDNFCTFCLTVQARGRHKWRPKDEILSEIRDFVAGGGKEVVFTGINLGAWGAESSNDYEASTFVDLVESVLAETSLERLRISSLGVEFCSDKLIKLFENPRIIAYAHLSIQSGSSKVLRAMNRHYDGEKVRDVLSKLRALKRTDGVTLNIGADLIVGFPGESEADFEDTREIVETYMISQLHAFPFSPHVDHYSVPAGSFPDQVPAHIRDARQKILLETGKLAFTQFATESLGKKLRLLVEKNAGETFSGWSENYLFINETNFIEYPQEAIARGVVVTGIYTKILSKGQTEE